MTALELKNKGYITTAECPDGMTIEKVYRDVDGCIDCGCVDEENTSSARGNCSDCRFCWVLCK